MTDMTNSETTQQPMLPDASTCVSDQNDELSKDSVIDYLRKTDEESVPKRCSGSAGTKHRSQVIVLPIQTVS